MKQTLFGMYGRVSLCAAMLAGTATLASAAAVEKVNLSGTGAATHAATALQDAINAVDNGGVVELIEAGTYNSSTATVPSATGTSYIPGGKSFTIRATVAGVVVESIGASGGSTFVVPLSTGTGYVAGNVNVTIEAIAGQRLTVRRVAGTGADINIEQRAGETVSVTMNRVDVTQTVAPDGGEAIKFNGGAGTLTGDTVTFTATDCTFSSVATGASGKSAIRVQSQTADFNNLTVDLTNSTLSSVNEGVIRIDAAATTNVLVGHHWTLTGCTLNSVDRGLEFDETTKDSSFTLTNTTINCTGTVVGNVILAANDNGADNNTWLINRCTFNNSTSTIGERCVRISYPGSTTNTITVNNSVFLTNVVGANSRCLELEGFGALAGTANTIFVNHCTFGAVGGSGVASTGRGLTASNSADMNFSNNVFLNFPSDSAVAGAASTGIRTGNVFAISGDETQGGTDRFFVAATGYPEAVAALNLDAGLVPQLTPTNSPAIANGDPAINVGGVDRSGNARPAPVGANPDSGAYEVNENPFAKIENWTSY